MSACSEVSSACNSAWAWAWICCRRLTTYLPTAEVAIAPWLEKMQTLAMAGPVGTAAAAAGAAPTGAVTVGRAPWAMATPEDRARAADRAAEIVS